jgi:ANTAR domain
MLGFGALRTRGGRVPVGSVPVQVAQGTVGSLNFYLAEPHEWDHSERNAAEVYGRLAGALLGSALTAELQGRLIEQLQWTLDHRILIEQAKGILMEREGISADARDFLTCWALQAEQMLEAPWRIWLTQFTGRLEVKPG